MTTPTNVVSPLAPGPAVSAFAVTTSDTVTFSATRALWVGSTGNVKVTMNDGTVVTLNSVPAGAWLDMSVTQVFATGTTASNIVGFR